MEARAGTSDIEGSKRFDRRKILEGGAAIDFCSYGAVLSRWLMAHPSRVAAMGGRYAKAYRPATRPALVVLGASAVAARAA